MILKPFERKLAYAALLSGLTAGMLCGQDTEPRPVQTQHVLFVGDSFTHGRYLPVRTYNNTPATGGTGSTSPSQYVVDENYNTTVDGRKEDTPGEYGPWGGIPGIFAELAHEAGLPYDVHLEAISATSLAQNYRVASAVIDRPLWNAVVLQEASFEPIPSTLTQNPKSDPQAFYAAVQTIEQGVHTAAPDADVYLYATWAPADTAYLDTTADGEAFSPDGFLKSLAELTVAYRSAYQTAADRDGHIRAIAPVGDAWALAWLEGVANPDPYYGAAPGVSLSFNYQPGSEPSTKNVATDAGYHHPSLYGAYLSGLVLFETITRMDVRRFGAEEQAAAKLGIAGNVAVQLQRVAWETVSSRELALKQTPAKP